VVSVVGALFKQMFVSAFTLSQVFVKGALRNNMKRLIRTLQNHLSH